MEVEFLFNMESIRLEDIFFDSADYLDSENVEEEVSEDIIEAMDKIKSNPSSDNKVFLLTNPIEGL